MKKKAPCDKLIALLFVVLMLASMFASAIGVAANDINDIAIKGNENGSVEEVKASPNNTLPPQISDALSKANDSEWASKPVRVNIQVDLKSEEDQKYLHGILNEIEARNWVTSVFVTGKYALNHSDIIKEIEDRGHYIGVYGWQDEDLTLLNYSEQFNLINKSISAVRSVTSKPELIVDFKPQNLKYNDDTIKALQDLKMKSITATFSANESFVQCPYAKSVGKVTFPYPITTDFSAVPISDVKIGSEEVLLDDKEEIFCTLTTPDYLSHLKAEYDEHDRTKDPLVITISPSVTGADETRFQAFVQFLDYIEEKGGKVKPTAPITVLGSYIPYLHISAPPHASVGQTITATVTFTAAIYCPKYYFRLYGKYPSEGAWTLLSEARHYVNTGTYSFSRSLIIPQPPGDESTYTIMVVGQGCSGTCWPTPTTYEAISSTTIDIEDSAKKIKLTATPRAIRPKGESVLIAQLQDGRGNNIAKSGVQIIFSEITNLGSISPATAVTDANGVATATFSAGDKNGTATVKASSTELEDGTATIKITEAGKPIITNVEPKYKNVFVSGIEVINRYNVFVDWGDGEPGKVVFELNENPPVEVPATSDSPSAYSEYNMGMDFYVWPATNELKVIAVNKEGIESDPYIFNPKVLPFSPWMLILLDPDDFSIILSPPIVKYNAKFEFLKTDNKVNIPCWVPYISGKLGAKAGADLDLCLKSSGEGSGKLTGSSKVYRDPEICEEDIGFDIGGSAFGKAKVVLDDIELKSGELGLELGGNVKKSLPIVKVLPQIGVIVEAAEKVPFVGRAVKWFANRAKIEGSVGPSISATGVFEGAEPGTCMKGIDCHGKYDLALKMILALKLGIKMIEAKVYGGGTPKVTLQSPDPSGDGWIGVEKTVVELLGGLKLKVWKFFAKLECVYDWPGESEPKCKPEYGFKLLSSGDSNIWKVVKRDYANKDYSTFVGGGRRLLALASPAPTQEIPIIHNAYPYAQPAIASDGNIILLLWVHDDINKPNMQGEEIYYSLWNGLIWSQPSAITNNYNLEFSPDITFDVSGNAVAVWEYNKNIFYEENATLNENFTSGFEIVYSVFNKTNLTWSSPVLLTTNEYMDYSPKLVGDDNGNIILIWSVSKNDTEMLYYSTWNGNTFSAPEVLKTNVSVITQSFAYKNGKLLHVWSQDIDDNFSTIGDEELYSSTWNGTTWGTSVRITSDSFDDEYPSVLYEDGIAKLLWLKITDTGNMLYQSEFVNGVWTNQSLASANTSIIDFRMTKDKDSNIVLVWEEIGNQGPDMYYLVYDKNHDSWSDKNQLTKDIAMEESITFLFINDTLMASYLKTDITLENITTNITGEEVNITNVPVFGNTSLYLISHNIFKDLAISNDDVALSDDNPRPGDNVTINATVHNIGDLSIDAVKVAFFDGFNGSQIGATQIIDTIPAGANASVSVNWTVPLLEQSHDIYVKVDPLNEIVESNESNNIAFVSTVLPDLIVNWSFASYSAPDRRINLNASIKNNGTISASNITVEFYYGNYTDFNESASIKIGTKAIDNLTSGDSKEIGITWDVSAINRSWYYIHIVIDSNNTIRESDETNNEDFVLAKVLPDLTLNALDINYSNTYEGTVFINITVHNKGVYDAENVTLSIYNGSPILNSSTILANKTVSLIGVNSNSTISYEWSASAGMYDIYVVIDPDNLVDELDESNNIALNPTRILQKFGLIDINVADTDNDGLYNYLSVGIEANIRTEGSYYLSGVLSDVNGSDITKTSENLYLESGEQILHLNFSGMAIRRHAVNGPYGLLVRLYDENAELIGSGEGNTIAYSYEDFQLSPGSFIDTYSERGVDSDGDGFYDYLEIDVGVSVTGNYTIIGNLYDESGEYIGTTHNSSGAVLSFDGMAIYEHGVNGSYNLCDLALYDDRNNLLDYRQDAYTTSPYNYTRFQPVGIVRGVVEDINGEPLSDAYLAANGPEFGSAFTDVNGSYFIRLRAGSYVLTVYPPSDVNLLKATKTVSVIGGQTTVANFTLQQGGGIITGVVKDYNGTPVSDAYILLTGPDYGSTTTDINGTYTVMGLRAGSYTVKVIPSNPNLMDASTSVNVALGGIATANFVLQKAGSIAGRVTDVNGTAVSNAILYLSGYETARYRVNESGYYVIPRLGAGSYTLNIHAPGYASWWIAINNIYVGSGTSIPVSVTLGQTTLVDFSKEMNFEYVDLTLIQGDIIFSNSTPMEGDPVDITSIIHNIGTANATNVTVQFFVGEPGLNNQIGSDQVIPYIAAGGTGTAQVNTSNRFGDCILKNGIHDIYVLVDPHDSITETNETNNVAFRSINVSKNTPPTLSNSTFSPNAGSWKDRYSYSVDAQDIEGNDVTVVLQVFVNGNWINGETKTCHNCNSPQTLLFNHSFTCVDRDQVTKYRFYYYDEVVVDGYYSGKINEGYYPTLAGLEGPTLDNSSYGLGIVEGAGAGYGSSFYSWYPDLYTVVQPGDKIYVTASDSINKVGIYDYSDDTWYYYRLNETFQRGELANITAVFSNHLNHFVRIRVYLTDSQRSFHMIKQTGEGGIVEGGYPGYGSSFTSWSTYANTIIRDGDKFYIAADAPVNRIKILNYADNEWYEDNITSIVPSHGIKVATTTSPKGVLINITSYLQPFLNKFVQVRILQDDAERNFHIIKRTENGGIVEGAQGDRGGSSFYSWYSSLYTSIQKGDKVFIAADDTFNMLKIDETYIPLDKTYNRGEVVDVSSYLQEYANQLIQIQACYPPDEYRNFHIVKLTPSGGIVEGGYPSSDSSFGSWSNDMYTLFRQGERIIIAPNDHIDTVKVYDFTTDTWRTINLGGNLYLKHYLVDITPYIADYRGHFIRLQVYYQTSQKSFRMIKAFEGEYVIHNAPPVLSNASISPEQGSWMDNYTYSVSVSDNDSEYVDVTLQVFTNDQWLNVDTKQALGMQQLQWNYQFTCLDRNQTAKYRFYYDDGVNTGYYPSKSGVEGPVLDNTSYGLGMVEGAGAGYGSSFYSWSGNLYTVVQPGDSIYVTASDSVNKIAIYDYSDDKWYYYSLNRTFLRGELADITSAFEKHLNHFVQVKVYLSDSARSFHLIKQTSNGGTVEGGYPGRGGSFTSWSTYANTIIREDDRFFVAADAPVNKIKVLNYTDDQWHEYDITSIVPGHGFRALATTTLPKGELIDITSYLQPFVNRFVQIKVLQDSTERNFHIIKRTAEGGIVEGAEGGSGGSSFYSWYSSLYTAIQKGERVFVTADNPFNRLRVLDKTTKQWKYINLSKIYERGEVADVSSYLQDYANHMLQIQVYSDTTLRNFHIVKISPDGGIVEGGYPSGDSSFNSWSSDMFTLFRPGDRIIISPTDYIDTVRVYDYTDDREYTYNLGGNVYSKYSLADITPYISAHEGHFIKLNVYYLTSKKSFHLIKTFEKQAVAINTPPSLSNESVSPSSGSWRNNYTYSVNVSDADSEHVDVTLQVFSNDQWINVEAKQTSGSQQQLEWNYQFTCLDRDQTAKYRFYYDDGVNTGYYPSESGAEGPALDNTSYGLGIVEGGGAGRGSSFYTWSDHLFTVAQPNDKVFIATSEPVNNIRIYDYTTSQWHTYDLDKSYGKGKEIDVTFAFKNHLNKFVQVKVYYNDLAKSFHMVKKTPNGGIVEGGYPGYGSSFTSWSTYANTIILPGDNIYVTPEYAINRVGIYNYSNKKWNYYNLSINAPAKELLDISHYVQKYTNHFVKIKTLTDSTERKFHIIKQTKDGGIVEGAEGGTAGSSFYSWYSSLYTIVQEGDLVFVAADNSINRTGIYDYTTGQWKYYNLNKTHARGKVVDISSLFDNCTNHIVQIKVYQDSTARNFHLIKISPGGGIVEGGYPNADSSFNSWANDMYTLFSHDDRILIAPTGYIDTVKIYDYADDQWHTVNLGGNVFSKYSLVDITPYIKEFEGHFIRLQVYYKESQKSFHLLKAKEGIVFDELPDLTLNAEDITFSNDNPVEGSQITISALIRNKGDKEATNFAVELFDGDPINGTKIGEEFVYLINPGSSKEVSVGWNVSAGIHDIYVSIDPMDNISESDEDNNVVFNTIGVLPDLILGEKDITFSNSMINATIHNIGGVNASNVTVQFFDGNPYNGGTLIGNRTIEYISPKPSFYHYTDLDGDGNSELIFGSYSNGVYIVDPATKTTLWNYNPGYWCNALAINDVDNDGKPELIFSCGRTNRFYVYGYNESYPLVQEFSASVGDIYDGTSGITTGDVDSDGTVEIIFPDASTSPDQIEIWGWNGTTFILENAFSPSGAEGIHAIAAEDVDNDGTIEIVFNDCQDYEVSLYVYGYNGVNYVEEWVSDDLGGYLQGIVIDDTDNDGNLEIWTGDRDHYGTEDGAVFVYQYTSPGVYTQEWISARNENGLDRYNSPTSTADWDKDGKKEIAIGCYRATDNYGHVWVYEYDEINEKYVLEWDIRPPSNDDHTTTPTFGDYDNDGIIELIIGDESGYIYIYNPDGVLEWSNGDYGRHVAGWSGDAVLITGEPDPRAPRIIPSKTVSITWNATKGVHDIYVVVDPANTILERNEMNNVAHKVLSIENVPDLAINTSDITFSNDNPAEGEFVSINATIHNIGDAPAFDVPVKFYYGNPANGTLIGTQTIKDIPPGGHETAQITPSNEYDLNWVFIRKARIAFVDSEYQGSTRPYLDSTKIKYDLYGTKSGARPISDLYTNIDNYDVIIFGAGVGRDGGITSITSTTSSKNILKNWVLNGGVLYIGMWDDGGNVEEEVFDPPGFSIDDSDDAQDSTVVNANHPVLNSPNNIVAQINDPNPTESAASLPAGATVILRQTGRSQHPIMAEWKYGNGNVFWTCLYAHNIWYSSTWNGIDDINPGYGNKYWENVINWLISKTKTSVTSELHDISVGVDPSNIIPEQNETNNLAFKTINVTKNSPPILSNATVLPTTGSWKDNYTYSLNISDIEGNNVNVTLQIFTNGHWINLDMKSANDTATQQTLTWNHTFTAVDRSQTAKYRFYYEDYVSKESYHSGTINSGYYPSINGSSGPVLDNTSYGLGIVEGAGAGRGSSFYSWSNHLYTVVQPNDRVFIAASEPIDNIRIYDYASDKWYTYNLDMLYGGGKEINITSAFQNHLNHFVQVKACSRDSAKNFHMIKQTSTGGTVEGGYSGYGSSFTSWSTYANTIVREGDKIYVAADAPINRIGVYDHLDEYWKYCNLSNTAPKGILTDITPVLLPYSNHIIQIKVLQDNTERNFHLIKRTEGGGIVEGAEGGTRGSSFYSWYSSLYTAIQKGEHIFVAADDQFNSIRVYDYTTAQWETICLDRRYNRSEAADITPYLQKYVNHLLQLQAYYYDSQRNFHLFKLTPNGGIVEGGYPNADSSFNSWANDMYTLFRHGDRLILASTGDFDTIKIYDYADDQWHTVNLSNVYPKYTLVDITPYITKYEGNFIRLQLYHQTSQKDFHMIKVFESISFYNDPPELSNASLSPDSGSWKDSYTYSVNVRDIDSECVNVTLQVFTNGQWINVKTKQTYGNPEQLEWSYQFTCLDRNQTAKYRFYYDDGINAGYYPSESGAEGPMLDDTSYGLGIVEGAGAGYGSSFYSWSGDLYMVVQQGDKIYVVASDAINRVGIYDYCDDKWYYYELDPSLKGEVADISHAFSNHLNHFVRIKVYFNDIARNFHIIKQTPEGGIVEGGYPGHGSPFTSWSKYINTIIMDGDKLYVAPEAPVNKIKIYDYIDEYWKYHDLNVPVSKAELVDITSYLQPYSNHMIQIKLLYDNTERNFHAIKRTKEGGIVEGAEGGTGGSSFYSWYPSLYTAIQKGDRIFVAADNQFNSVKVYDYTTGQWEKINLDRRYERSEVAEVGSYLQKYANHLIQLQVYHYEGQRNFHLIKISPEGGIVEGGYPNSDSSFGSWSNDAYTLFRPGERIIAVPTDYIDTIKVYDYTGDNWDTIDLKNMYPKYSLVDLTPYLSSYKGHFIRLQMYYQASQKSFHIIKAFKKKIVELNEPPTLSNASLSPTLGSWKDEYSYSVAVSDVDSDTVNVTLQVFTNNQWVNVNTKSGKGLLSWNHTFSCLDMNQTAKYRFYYDDGVNTGYYPSHLGIEGPVLDDASYRFGTVEGAGSGYGSSFYSWSSDLYTVVQPGDYIYIAASDSVNKVGIYDYSDDRWHYYRLNDSFWRGENANVTDVFSTHLNHFVRIRVYFNDMARNFHMIKQTHGGGTVEGGYPGYGSSFTRWSRTAHTMLEPGDKVYIAPDAQINRIGVYDYIGERWKYYNLSNTVPKGELADITPYLSEYINKFIQIKVYQDTTERNFHIIKRTKEGGIVEGADGNSGGSSFYSWYSYLYIAILPGDKVFVSANAQFNKLKVHDYTSGQWETISLDRKYEKTEVADVTPYLQKYVNHMIQLQVYHYENQRSFHLVKTNPNGGIVEGGYPDSHASFGSWSNDLYTLFRKGDRIVIASNDYIDTIKVYDYANDQWYTIDLGNVYSKYSLVDITPYLSEHKQHFIRLQVYYKESQKNFHMIKTFTGITAKLTASIISPSNGQTFTQGQIITFIGSASGGTPPYTYNWTSSIDGEVGNNNSFNRADLSIGSHIITLTVTDSSGLNDTTQVTIFVNPDIIPPIITNITAINIKSASATILWTTNEPSDSLVKYGTEPGNYTLTAYNRSNVTLHIVNLTGLTANTTYYYVVNSTDPRGNSNESSEYNFITSLPPVLTTIEVAPSTVTLNISETQQFSATAKDQYGNEMSGIVFDWTSSNTTVGTIDVNGLFTAKAAGKTTVIAANGTICGTADVIVTTTCIPPNIAWNMTISATNQLEPVIVGMHPNATDGYDADFDAFAQTPVQGKVILILDGIYSTSIKKTRCYNESVSWNLSVGVPTGETATLSWNAPPNVNLTITEGSNILYSGVELSEGGHELLITAKLMESTTFSLKLEPGWNMVSLPLVPDNSSVYAVFGSIPTLDTMPVVTWEAPSFVKVEEIEPKIGYWVFTPADATINVTGKPITNTTLILEAGWNMVGTVGIDNLTISDIPNQVPQRPAVTWVAPSFVKTDVIEPGKSAWVFVTTDTIVTMGKAASGEMKVKAVPIITKIKSVITPATTEEWNLTISATNQLEPVTFGIHPDATNGYDEYDVFAQTPVQGKVIMILDKIYAKEINKDKLTWNLSVGVPAGQNTTLTWYSSKIPADVSLMLDGIDMKLQNSIELGEGSHSFVINGTTGELTAIFDTGAPSNPYPSISGTHTGDIIPSQDITVHKIYTYPCAGTGGHTEYVRIWNDTWAGKEAYWSGYQHDWHNITFDEPFTLFAKRTYHYEIITGSYPQIIHKPEHTTLDGSYINCTSFVDANGKTYTDWIPAIRIYTRYL